jgi:hypothetical protein
MDSGNLLASGTADTTLSKKTTGADILQRRQRVCAPIQGLEAPDADARNEAWASGRLTVERAGAKYPKMRKPLA